MRHGLSVILEAGDAKRDKGVELHFNDIAKRNKLEGYLKTLTTAPKDSSRALQMADYLAYFSWQQAEKASLGTLTARSEFHDIGLERVWTHVALAEGFTPNPTSSYRSQASRKRSP
jgi:hypothetical protein